MWKSRIMAWTVLSLYCSQSTLPTVLHCRRYHFGRSYTTYLLRVCHSCPSNCPLSESKSLHYFSSGKA